MIPAPSEHQIHASPAPTVDFSINKADAVHIMTLLRNTLYSDKVAAVVREYSANAWDAHREAGKADVPIRVRMPTSTSPVFEVRDYGRGIPHEQMESRFCSFGASTKRESNDAVGCFGIGCKSGWAYSKSFTVVSRNGGRCCTYVAALDPSGQGQLRLLDDSPCDEDDTGMTIQIAVRPGDVGKFVQYADFYCRFSPLPDIDIPLVPRSDIGPLGRICSSGEHTKIAIMGCVTYPIDGSQVFLGPFALRRGFELRFQVGELDVAASREALEYSDRTRQAIEKRVADLVAETLAFGLRHVEKAATFWEQRLALRQYLADTDNYLLGSWVAMAAGTLSLKHAALFDVLHYRSKTARALPTWCAAQEIVVSPKTRVVLIDESARKSWKRYETDSQHDYIVRPKNGSSHEQTKRAFLGSIDSLKATGIPVVDMSSLKYHPIERRSERLPPVHPVRARMFELANARNTGPRSWKQADREPTDQDIFVILSNWDVDDMGRKQRFYLTYLQDAELLKKAGETMPAVFGYRGERSSKFARGTRYHEWRQKKLAQLLKGNEYVRLLRERMRWRQWSRYEPPTRFIMALPEKHPARFIFAKMADARSYMSTMEEVAGKELVKLDPKAAIHPATYWRKVVERWPLLESMEDSLEEIWNSKHESAWIDYLLRKQPRSKKK